MECANPNRIKTEKLSIKFNIGQIISMLLLSVVSLYFFFDYSFTQIRLPFLISEGIPIGEIILILTLPFIHYTKVFSRIGSIINLIPLFVWWLVGIIQVIIGFSMHGSWALRDATSMLEAFFLLLGFIFALRQGGLRLFFDWLPKLTFITALYCFGYPLKDWLIGFVPTIQSAAGSPVPVMFTYTSKYLLMLFAASYFFIYTSQLKIKALYQQFLMIILIGYTIIFFQARSIYFELMMLIGFGLRFQPKKTSQIFWVIGIISFLILIFPLFGLELKGRLGKTVTIDYLFNHFLSSFGIVANEDVEGSASGMYQRMDWWSALITKWLGSVNSTLFGLGYGIPLTDFTTTVQVREPHNSYLSVLARLGLVGFAAYIWTHISLIKAWYKTYRRVNFLGWIQTKQHLLWMMSFFILMWGNGFAEDNFEKPFITIPYYFFWGVMIGLFHYVKKAYVNADGKPIDENPTYS